MKTFQQFLETQSAEVNEAFWDSMKQGYQQAYQQARQPTQPQQQPDPQQLQQAQGAMQKASGMAQQLAAKMGIQSIPLTTAIIASGLVGGPAAIPFATFMYLVKRPIMKGVSKGFDAGVAGIQKGAQAVKGMMQQPQPAMAGECFVFDASTGMFIVSEGIGDWTGKAIGKAVGTLSGQAVKTTQAVGNFFAKAWNAIPQVLQFAKQHPGAASLTLGKVAFMMGAGALIGAGIGTLTHDTIDGIIQAMGDKGVPAEELNWLRHNFKMDYQMDKGYGGEQPMAHISGDELSTPGGELNPDPYYQPDEHGWNKLLDKNGNWIGTPPPAQHIAATDWMNNASTTIDGKLSSLKHIFGSIGRHGYVGEPGTDSAVIQYNVTLLPQPGETPQSILQNAYRELATKLHQTGIKVTDLRYTGEDPSGAIKAMLSVAPPLTAAGAITGAAASTPQKKGTPA